MKTSMTLIATVLVCVASLLISQVTARPYDNQLADRDRQAILHYAAKIVRLALHGSDTEMLPADVKRNSGMLDAVMNMPDLMRNGRK